MMRRLFFALAAVAALFGTEPKRILILSSHGGYSHEGAAKMLTEELGGRYACTTVFPITEYRPWGVKNSENIYNYLFARGANRTIEMLVSISQAYFKLRRSAFERHIEKAIERIKPDLVISVAPYINGFGLRAAHKAGIPFLLTTLDEHSWIWLNDFKKPQGARFKVAAPRATLQVMSDFAAVGIEAQDVTEVGQLLRTDFQKELPSKQELRAKHNLPLGKKVILIMMGGAGSNVCVAYAQKAAQLDLGAHIIVCTGRYEALRADIEAIKPHRSNTLQALGFTHEMAELMGASDLIITKPGPSAVFEAVSIGRAPILLDTTIRPIAWEQGNVAFVEKHEMGACVRRVKHLPKLIRRYLEETPQRAKALAAFKAQEPNRSSAKLIALVEELCPPS
jgi:UDP-N-acetylglucosamine:LPS N-acetylglucosamine transferase